MATLCSLHAPLYSSMSLICRTCKKQYNHCVMHDHTGLKEVLIQFTKKYLNSDKFLNLIMPSQY
jgi:hypothetical protein